ncbi:MULTISPECIES: DUF6953 family protein [unclassified Shinella]|jgi:hypothetical protein|uniref:DUF6953 family protein n=1 Tax=unclassified Shinella TaxID=2643062 RepID=UPI00234F384F|nr:hypothetical protein [Shinella sp. HY16]MDC7261860.1 hypothetical protein [Shinella sp. HY16]MDC7268755.1 hypothetical protein [Shinella sp. YZ44]
MTTPSDVATWMVEQLKDKKFLYQEHIVYSIQKEFGDEFVFINGNGNLGITKPVLTVFNKMTPDVVWSRSDRCWRNRASYDKPGRMQD